MSYEPVPGPRSIVAEQREGPLIRIPSKRHWSVMVLLKVWLAGWTAGGCLALYSLACMAVGEEQVLVRRDARAPRSNVWVLGRTREDRISEPGTGSGRSSEQSPPWSARASARIAFDHGAQTIRIPAAIDAAGAQMLLDRLRNRYPFEIPAD